MCQTEGSDGTAESSVTPVNQYSPQARGAGGGRQRAFGRSYWLLNGIEMFERLGYFAIRSVVPIYLMQATEPGGLHLTALDKGFIYAWWAIFQSFLPIVTGGFADRYGFKRVLFLAISMNCVGYVVMAFLPSYYGFFAGVLFLATGTAFFKPGLQGALAQNLTKENSSLGWGILYWVVNIGAVAAPVLATLILGRPHSAEGWRNLFLASAGYTAVNLLLLLAFKDIPSGASKTESVVQVLVRTIRNVFEPRLMAWLLIMSGFWLMMYQLWDLHPNFIEDWVDSSMLAAHVPFDSWREYGDSGMLRVPQQILLGLNAALIVLLVLPLSWLVGRMRTLSAMLIGMSVATIGVLVAGLTGNGWVLLLGIVFFSFGEMLTGPKKSEYLGLIAPKGKKGLYLGYASIPVGIGVGFGSWMAGHLYGDYGEKASLALKHLAANTHLVAQAARSVDWSDSLHRLPGLLHIERRDALTVAGEELGLDRDAAVGFLRSSFRHDRGQITNLAMQYLAQQPDNAEAMARCLAAEPAGASAVDAARFVHLLPAALGVRRMEALDIVRELVNRESPTGLVLDDSAVIDLLWDRFDDDPHTLNNLALEYLAQGTDRLVVAVSAMDFADPRHDIVQRLGIDRTKSFAALAAATVVDEVAFDHALDQLRDIDDVVDRLSVMVIRQEHRRFSAVARKDWSRDIAFLTELIGSDHESRRVVLAHIDDQTAFSRLTGWFRDMTGLRGDDEEASVVDGINYRRLIDKPHLIQQALAVKDWACAAPSAAKLLGLNPFEAGVVAASDADHAGIRTTQLLWRHYKPHLHVWLPFAAIGVVATIALAIFGRLARRWPDMNA